MCYFSVLENKRYEPLNVESHLKVKSQPEAPMLSPTYGKPTPDTHALLDETLPEPVDVILETRYVQSPRPKGLWN